jgi:hypothetical protein
MKLIDLIEAKKENNVVSFMKNVVYDTPGAVYTELSNIRKVATKANMMCCPIEYFDMDNALKGKMFDYFDDKKAVVNSILNFQKYFAEKADVYVLSPLQFYDVNKHIKSNVDKDIYCPQYEQAFFAINALIPTLRQTENRLNNLEGIQRQMQEAAARSIRIEDPMLFAIPKSKTIHGDVNAIIGTCWGKDISSSVIKSLNLKCINHKLRKDIISTYKQINVSSIEIAKQEELKFVDEMIEHDEKQIHDLYNRLYSTKNAIVNWYTGFQKFSLLDKQIYSWAMQTYNLNNPDFDLNNSFNYRGNNTYIYNKNTDIYNFIKHFKGLNKIRINIETEINELQEKKSAIYQKYNELQS